MIPLAVIQSVETHLYSVMCCKWIRGARWTQTSLCVAP